MSTDAPTPEWATPEQPNLDSGLTDEETAAVVASARQTPERVTLTADEREILRLKSRNADIWGTDPLIAYVERILTAREQALREGIREAKAEAWDEGRRAEHRDWVLVFDLSTPDEDRQPWPNPYRDQTEAVPDD